jgi:hypothetical protein
MTSARREVLSVGVTALMLIGTAGCTAASQPEPQPTPNTSPDAASASPAPPEGSSSASVDCLNGRYHLTRVTGLREGATYGSGEGGDVTVAFDDGSYELSGAGKEPVTVILAGQQGKLNVDGTARGSYAIEGSKVTFTAGNATGSARLRVGGTTQTFSMAEVAKLLAPNGTAVVTCAADEAAVAMDNIHLELERP